MHTAIIITHSDKLVALIRPTRSMLRKELAAFDSLYGLKAFAILDTDGTRIDSSDPGRRFPDIQECSIIDASYHPTFSEIAK